MCRNPRLSQLWTVVFSVLAFLIPSSGFGQAAPPAAPPPRPQNPPPAETEEQPAASEDPAVAAILATNPLTPRERIRAALVFLKLGRADLAKQMLAKVLESPLDPLTLNGLHEEFGSATFFQLASRADLTPEGSQLAQLVFDAVKAFRSDPARLSGLVEQLCTETGTKWAEVGRELIDAGTPALVPLCQVLLDETRMAAWPRAAYVLQHLRPQSEQALISLLLTVPEDRQAGIIYGLRALHVKAAVPFLLTPEAISEAGSGKDHLSAAALREFLGATLTRPEAVRFLLQSVDTIAEEPVPLGQEVVELVEWDSEKGTIGSRRISYELWRRERACRLAVRAAEFSPRDPVIQDLAAIWTLEKLGYRYRKEWGTTAADGIPEAKQQAEGPNIASAGRSEEIFREVHRAVSEALAKWNPTAEDMNRWLSRTLEKRWYCGAWAAVCWLAESGEGTGLAGASVPPLVRALEAPDRELRFTAVEAVLKLAPGGGFRGASQVWQELLYFARGKGVREAVVAAPSPIEGTQMAAFLKSGGFESVQIVSDGAALLRLVPERPDCEVVLVSAALQNPPVELTLQRLRAHPRGGEVPVLIYGETEWLPKADRISQKIPMWLSVAKPRDVQDLTNLVQQVRLLPGADRTLPADRIRHARTALTWLVAASENPPEGLTTTDLEEAARGALQTPGLEPLAIQILAQLATPAAQMELVEAVSREVWPLDLRLAALGGFGEAVKKRGVQLTTEQILRQYERYNQSAHRDPAVQRLLGLVLDWIEAPARIKEVGTSGNL